MKINLKTYYSHGKLLLTGEYVVLDGALSLALPTKYGQSLIVEPIDAPKVIWKSFDEEHKIWFEDSLVMKNHTISSTTQNHPSISSRLMAILNSAKQLNPTFLNAEGGFKIRTHLEFPTNWGLGSSSTLINNIAQWAEVDAFQLLKNTFGGSGYDVACAQHTTAITYQLNASGACIINEVDFKPPFIDSLYFVHLNKKQNSREGIKQYQEHKNNLIHAISEINDLTLEIMASKTLEEFEKLINLHEIIISKITQQITVKELLFPDYIGSIKSLGAWGGDFILASSKTNPSLYFNKKGFATVIPYKAMVYSKIVHQ